MKIKDLISELNYNDITKVSIEDISMVDETDVECLAFITYFNGNIDEYILYHQEWLKRGMPQLHIDNIKTIKELKMCSYEDLTRLYREITCDDIIAEVYARSELEKYIIDFCEDDGTALKEE